MVGLSFFFEYTFKNSSEFAKDIICQSSHCFMASLDVDWLFTHVPLDETTKICIVESFESEITVSGFNKMKCLKCFH